MAEIIYDDEGNAIAQIVEIEGVPRRVPPPRPDPQFIAGRENLAAAEKNAASKILDLKTAAAGALVAGGMSGEEAYAAGSTLVLQHANLIQAYILAGGNPVAKKAFLDSIEENPPFWWSKEIYLLFASYL